MFLYLLFFLGGPFCLLILDPRTATGLGKKWSESGCKQIIHGSHGIRIQNIGRPQNQLQFFLKNAVLQIWDVYPGSRVDKNSDPGLHQRI
jgi:hypothetical protein